MAKFTCPFCLREYSKATVLYVCPDCGTITKPKAFDKEPIKCSNSKCGGLATLRRCPSCGNNIPKTALETPNLPFSIVGVSNSGKTNYITVMLHELGQSSGLKIALGHQTNDTLERQTKNYQMIYEKHRRPESTEAGEKLPQIWYVRNLHKKHGNKVPTYTFTIFDGAGEDHEHALDPSSTVCRYINASKAIILTIDPLVLPAIRRNGYVDPEVLFNSLGGSSGETKQIEDVINSVADYIKTARAIKSTQMLKIPVAVVLTKFDTILNSKGFGAHALIRGDSLAVQNGKVNVTEMNEVDGEIRNWLKEIGEESFITTLESHFTNFKFFGVSSYGQPPINQSELANQIRPHRVLDPILWLFKNADFID